MSDELIKDVRKVQLDILIKLDEICKKNGLHYYLAFGTCLGALRHKGFIPWDDDIDVLMPYTDAKKLIDLQREFGDRYFVQSKETDLEYESIVMRIRDEYTTCIEKNELKQNIHKGIYIDIYPYYECSNNKIVRFLDILRANILRLLVYNKPVKNHGKIISWLSQVILSIYSGSREQKIKELEERLIKVRGNEILDYHGEDITLFTAISYPKEWFANTRKLEFEGKFFDGAIESEKYLRKRYGDYMKMPSIEDQVHRHNCVVLDPYKSYTQYEEKMNCM